MRALHETKIYSKTIKSRHPDESLKFWIANGLVQSSHNRYLHSNYNIKNQSQNTDTHLLFCAGIKAVAI